MTCGTKDGEIHRAEKREAIPAQIERLKRARQVRLNGRISDPPLSENRENLATAQDEG